MSRNSPQCVVRARPETPHAGISPVTTRRQKLTPSSALVFNAARVSASPLTRSSALLEGKPDASPCPDARLLPFVAVATPCKLGNSSDTPFPLSRRQTVTPRAIVRIE